MHPPEWVCEELYRLHPQARLGWLGMERGEGEDTLNKGVFALLQLYHVRDAERTYYTLWEEGPVFGRRWDRLQRRPVMLSTFHPQDVFSGKFLSTVKRWMKPLRERVLESRIERGKDYQQELDDIAEAQGDWVYWKSKQTDATRPEPIPKKHLTQKEKDVLSGDFDTDVTNKFVDDLPSHGEPLR